MKARQLWAAVVLGIAAGGACRACGLNPMWERLVNAVAVPSSGAVDPERPAPDMMARIWAANDLYHGKPTQDAFALLAASRSEAEWRSGIAALTERKAAGCLIVGLYHPDLNVRIQCARALGSVATTPRQASAMLAVVKVNATRHLGRNDAPLHGLFQHALADSLDRILNTHTALRDGEDPERMLAAIPRWETLIQERNAAETRAYQEEARKAAEKAAAEKAAGS